MEFKIRTLQYPEKWEATKYVSWPPSWKKPMVRVPEQDGSFRSFSIGPNAGESELELLERCRDARDAAGMAIWGKGTWWNMVRFPARSSTKPRKNKSKNMVHNGVSLVERPNSAPYYSASWYEVDPENDPAQETSHAGNRIPRKKRRKSFSFGTSKAKYHTQEAAKEAAIAFIKDKQKEVYVRVT